MFIKIDDSHQSYCCKGEVPLQFMGLKYYFYSKLRISSREYYLKVKKLHTILNLPTED